MTGITGDGAKIAHVSKLSAQESKGAADIIITNIDFKRTYAKTHEADFDPYCLNPNKQNKKSQPGSVPNFL